ncbi:Ig-like domain-containing protein [Neobacillus sp. NPDC058068]|uniref:Ig-like domain-containing protein n=1 Tax=Neobacillus sp. NPDC058068 TaxID=3346325 RepID=UPI0036DADB56
MYAFIRKYKKLVSLCLTALMLLSMVNPNMAKAASDPVTLAIWDFSKGQNLTATAGVDVNLDKQLSISGATMTGYNAGPTSGISVPNANTWTNNPSFWQVPLSTKGYQNITLSSKQYGSATGPKDFKVQYSLDGANWKDIADGTITISTASTWVTTNVSLPNEANNQELIFVRWLKASETSINNGSVAATGTNRIADIIVTGVPSESTPDPDPNPNPDPDPIVEKTAAPVASKITYTSYTNVSGASGAVAKNATVKLYFDDNNAVATTTAGADGAFSFNFENPQLKSVINITAQEDGKTSSDKVAVNYNGPKEDPKKVSPGDVVFSQLYVNGGNSGAFYKTKFFELYNNTDKDIDLNGWSIAYTSASSMSFGAGQALSGTIKAHGYFLVAGSTGATGQDLPVTPDVTTTLNPSGSAGGAFVLASKKTAVTGVDDPDAIDLLAYTDGTGTFKNPLYWGSPISDATMKAGTIIRKTDIGSDPRTAFGMGNGWFTKDPSKDFTFNKPSGGNTPEEMFVRNSKFMFSPDTAKITFTHAGGTATVVGQPGSVPASATVKAYEENGGTVTSQKEAKAAADGSFTMSFTTASSIVYLTQTDTTQPTALESSYARIDAAGTAKTVTLLSELRKNDAKGFPVNVGYTTTIEGVAVNNNTPAGNVKTNFNLQDSTGAINVVNKLDPATSIKEGAKYKIDGRVVFNAGLTQFIPTAIKYVGDDNVPAPEHISIDAVNETNESKYVTFVGKVTNIPTNGPDYDVTVSDETGDHLAIVRIQGSIEDIEQGSSYAFNGIVGQYKKIAPFTSGYYLLASSVKGQLALAHTQLTKAYTGFDVSFSAMAKNADSVTLYYKGETDSSYKQVSMNSADGRNYNGKILKADVPTDKFFYYIEAVSAEGKKSVGDAANPILVNVVSKTDGPVISNPTPENGDVIDSRYPTISVKLEDASGVDTQSATIAIDGKDFTAKAIKSATEIKLVLTKAEELTEGDHSVIVSVKDNLGNRSEFSWKFTVAKRFVGGNHYRGTTHNHTNISHDAAGSPESSLLAAQKYHYDYYAFSDHSHDIDASLVNKDTVDHKGMKERTGGSDWKLTKDLAKQYTKDGKFVVFPGFEMTSTTWGHSNVFGTDNFIDRVVDGGAYQKLQNYYSWAITYDDIVAQFNHPKMSANAFDNFIPYDKKVDKLFTMLEVGNGSGMYSYANAEDKYYSALDIGWHVAPTYGEDNHDATWGQTKKRTVIVADELTTNSLLEAMKKMRVYMSEDPNFTLDVSASGFYMGSTVDTDTLDFNISGSDPVLEKATDPDYSYIKTPSNDNIAKVELITNHGRVIDTYVPKEDTTSFTWNPSVTVAGGQQWFVVKVTQKDGDQIYSAPIWSQAKDVAVNVSNIGTPDGAIIGGVASTLTAGVSNLGTVTVSNIKAKFYYDKIDAEHFIADASIDSLAANGSADASVVWKNPVAGTHNIIVVLSADSHDLGDNNFEQSFVVKAPLGKTIMIDGTHGNENTKGDLGTYKDNLKLFTTVMKQQGYTVVENATTLSDEVLKNVDVLMVTHPTSSYGTNEIAAIKKFVTNGGSLLMTEKSNFGGSNQNLNTILSEVGSTIAVNNDGVFDETKEGNFWSTPLTSNFSVRLHPTPVSNGLTDFVPTIEYYSGSSLAKNDGTGKKVELTDSSTVTILARGNESTFQDSPSIKADSVSYNVQTSNGKTGPALDKVTGGSTIPMIASEELGKGRVVVSGMNIFNDKQIDQTFSPKGNERFAVNVVNWLSHLEPKVKSIGDARKLTDGTNVVVEGTVITTVFFDAVYIQDSTGGIMAFNDVPVGSLQNGDKVRIYGHIKTFENNLELEFGSFAESIVKLGTGPQIEPKLVSTKDSVAEENQGSLVKVIGKVVSIYDENSYVIDDGSGSTLVFTDGYVAKLSGTPVPSLKVGDTFEAVGLSGKFSEGSRIRVRDTRELIGISAAAPGAPVVNPVSDKDTVITGTAEASTNVVAKVDGKEIGSAAAGTDGKFEIKIAKQVTGTKIVVTATNAAGKESVASEVTVIDVTAPDAPQVNEVTDADEVVSGTAEAGLKVTAKVDSKEIGSATADETGQFEIKIAKQKAGMKISVTATDAAGNESTATEITVKDHVIVQKTPVVYDVLDTDKKVIGKAEVGSTVTISVGKTVLGSAKTDKDGNFSVTLKSAQKAGTVLTVIATDKAGVESPSVQVTVMDKATAGRIVVNEVKAYDKKVTGKAEAGSMVTIKVGSSVIGTAQADKNGSFSITLKASQKAGKVLTVTATDKAGNVISNVTVIVVD